MPQFRSFANQITVEDVSIGLQQILLAPQGTAWTPGRVDVSSPPLGFFHVGAVQDDAPQLGTQKGVYQLQTGIPSVLQYQAVLSLSGTLTAVFLSVRNSRAYLASGGLRPVNVANTPSAGFGVVTSVANHSRQQIVVNSATATSFWKVGDMVVTDASTSILTTLNEAFISSIQGLGTNSITISLSDPHGFPILPTHGNPIFTVAMTRFAIGTNVLPFFRVLGITDFSNGSQVVHDFAKATPAAQFAEALRTGQDARTAMQMNLFGYVVTTPYDSAGQLVISERFWFPPTSIGL